MGRNRRGETGRVPYRSGRYFSVNGNWYFATREAAEQGPFQTRAMAQAALTNFVRDRSFAHSPPRATAPLQRETAGEEPDEGSPAGLGHRFYW